MSEEKPQTAVEGIRDLAAQIYIGLVSDKVTVAGNNVSISANPDSLAKISFKLADAFAKVDAEMRVINKPVTTVANLDKIDFDAFVNKAG